VLYRTNVTRKSMPHAEFMFAHSGQDTQTETGIVLQRRVRSKAGVEQRKRGSESQSSKNPLKSVGSTKV
jgi:hypothetical protein